MNNITQELISRMKLSLPATSEMIIETERQLGIKLPEQYVNFMLESNGAEGCVGPNSYLQIWPVDQIVERNAGYKVEEYTSGLVYFASDGGGMAYAFDKRAGTMPIVEIPFESIHVEDAKLCGNTFVDFLQYLYDYK